MTRAGFVAVLGRPNVGKSTLVNRLVGAKVTITARTPNTTRQAVRGVLTEGDVQVVLVDTPGLHRARSALGSRLNESARAAAEDVEAVLVVLDATAPVGPGDRQAVDALVARVRTGGPVGVVVVNKVDRADRAGVAEHLRAAAELVAEAAGAAGRPEAAAAVEYFPVSARTGRGVEALAAHLLALMPPSPFYFPDEEVSDQSEERWIAELVREQLLRHAREELPHSIHCRVVEVDGARVVVEILVERDSQKGIVIGAGGRVLKDVGTAARRQMPEGTYLELRVRVEPGWQRRAEVLDRLGY